MTRIVLDKQNQKIRTRYYKCHTLVIQEYLWEEGFDTHGDDRGEDFVVHTKESYWVI